MAPIIASQDIAALVAAFPPPLPTKGQPSLIRSSSGNRYLNSHKILSRFRALLETEPSRLRLSDLPHRLGIQSSSWIFDCYEHSIHLSRDKEWLVPEIEFGQCRQQLRSTANEQFVPAEGFLSQTGLSSESWEGLSEGLSKVSTNSPKAGVYVAQESLVRQTRDEIYGAIEASKDDKVDLKSLLPTIPIDVLFECANERLASNPGRIDAANDHLVFVPAAYESIQSEREASGLEARVNELVQLLETQGFFEVPHISSPDADKAGRRYATRQSDEHRLDTLWRSDTLATIDRTKMEAGLTQMRANVGGYLEVNPLPKYETVDHVLRSHLISQSSNPAMAKFILRTSYETQVLAALVEIVRERKWQRFEALLQSHLIQPLELYSLGLREIEDAALKQRLDVYILDHFKGEPMQLLENSVREQALLSHDKSRSKDLEKFIQLGKSTANLADLEIALSKFAKKCKIPSFSAYQLSRTKHVVLKQKVKSMRQMPRASDVLQNATWILLAESCDGLFMSPGKDTTRMIKQYFRFGDAEKAKRLEEWRDAIKKNEPNDGDIKNMIELASETVRNILGDADGN